MDASHLHAVVLALRSHRFGLALSLRLIVLAPPCQAGMLPAKAAITPGLAWSFRSSRCSAWLRESSA